MYQILVAEDESLERKVLCKTLKKHFGEFAGKGIPDFVKTHNISVEEFAASCTLSS